MGRQIIWGMGGDFPISTTLVRLMEVFWNWTTGLHPPTTHSHSKYQLPEPSPHSTCGYTLETMLTVTVFSDWQGRQRSNFPLNVLRSHFLSQTASLLPCNCWAAAVRCHHMGTLWTAKNRGGVRQPPGDYREFRQYTEQKKIKIKKGDYWLLVLLFHCKTQLSIYTNSIDLLPASQKCKWRETSLAR